MTTTTVYYASNNEKQPNRFQLVIGSCSYELPKIEIYEILECIALAYGYQKEPFIEEQTECFVKGNRCIHVSQQATTLTFVVNDLRTKRSDQTDILMFYRIDKILHLIVMFHDICGDCTSVNDVNRMS